MKSEELPERLLTAGHDDFERHLVAAIAHERPSPELRERMAHTIGVCMPAPGGPMGDTGTQTSTAPAKAAASASSGSTAALPWISLGALVLAVAGVVVGSREWKTPARQERPAPAPAAELPAAPPPLAPAVVAPGSAVEAPPGMTTVPPQRRSSTRATTNRLQDQIAIIDAARAAVSASAGDRALDLLHKYQDKYPAGTFRQEAAALGIEAVAQLGRIPEARALAKRFRAEYGDNPQTDRVLRIAGLSQP